jgi:hypothetical protein
MVAKNPLTRALVFLILLGLERRFIVVDVQDTTIRSISRPNPQAGMVAKSFECDELIMIAHFPPKNENNN